MEVEALTESVEVEVEALTQVVEVEVEELTQVVEVEVEVLTQVVEVEVEVLTKVVEVEDLTKMGDKVQVYNQMTLDLTQEELRCPNPHFLSQRNQSLQF